MNLKQPKAEKLKPNLAELERIAKSQGVKPFNFDESAGEGAELWNSIEFDEFETWLKDTRIKDTRHENTK
jgi:hypothetical protein